MTKMNMPEIKVVRFNESDVIVASGGTTYGPLGVYGFNDNAPQTGRMTYGGADYTNDNYNDLVAIIGDPSIALNVHKDQHRAISVMFPNEQTTQNMDDVATANGTYEWNGHYFVMTVNQQ